MSVDQTDVVDSIGTDRESGRVVLTISDHLSWDENERDNHFRQLEEKIHAYLRFIESGQIHARYPGAKDRHFEIRAVMKYGPPAKATDFLEAARDQLAVRGIAFSYRVLPD